MSVYKYVSPEVAVLYLRGWALRITPPSEFNDPFELKPTVDLSFDDLVADVPQTIREELTAALMQSMQWRPNQPGGPDFDLTILVANMVSFILDPIGEERIQSAQAAGINVEELFAFRRMFVTAMEKTIDNAKAVTPQFVAIAEGALHSALHRALGLLCLTGSGKHPLMWAHYAESHRGAMLEFDEGAPCFNRRRSAEDECGFLRRVWYSDSRPRIAKENLEDASTSMVLTKALEWAYEQELRLLWPLEMADRVVDSGEGAKIHLIEVPPSALKSITLGCKARDAFVREVVTTLAGCPGASNVALRKAVPDERTFSLNYVQIYPFPSE